jgi:tetratricopeptide (TPR) repeat protein
MSNLPDTAAIAVQNEEALQELIWAIEGSQGQFKPFLVHCNYSPLRRYSLGQLRELYPSSIAEIELSPTDRNLYTTLRSSLTPPFPPAVAILGLEGIRDLDSWLSTTNLMRNELQNDCPVPLVLWVNDDIIKRTIRLAPDFADWCTSIELMVAPEDLLAAIRNAGNLLFSVVLETGADRFTANRVILGDEYISELRAALRELQNYSLGLTPLLEANYQFAVGRDLYLEDEIDRAIEHYQNSLNFWQPLLSTTSVNLTDRETSNLAPPLVMDVSAIDPTPRLRIAAILFHLGLCLCRKADLSPSDSHHHYQQARPYFEQCLQQFDRENRSDLVARFIGKLGEVLLQLKEWDALQALAKKSQALHQKMKDSSQLARDFGFLAEVALDRKNWMKARQLAMQARDILETLPADTVPEEQQWHRAWYLLLLGRSQRHLQEIEAAIQSLEAASEAESKSNLYVYIEILNELRSIYYYDRRNYLKAFELRNLRRSIEQQLGVRAFSGAGYLKPQTLSDGSIATIPGRQKDIDRLVARVASTQYKLTVIYGQSGVGKSSLVNAGLVPSLQLKSFATRDVVPIYLRIYTDWERELGSQCVEALSKKGIEVSSPIDSIAGILDQLRKNEQSNLLSVLIFDQFEEFFFFHPTRTKRKEFLEFLGNCLNIPFSNVILSLREDYIHNLLLANKLSNMAAIDRDILSKNVLYRLGNFSPEEAKEIINDLTQRSQFKLDPELIEVLVQELSVELGEVRPIELQVVGAQMQAEEISTLEQYKKSGSKDRLVQRYLEVVIKDCGEANRTLAQLVLFLLTDENNTRPPKTRKEIEQGCQELASESMLNNAELDTVLNIFVESGLIFLLPEVPSNRYQLVHDYLVSFIRQKQDKNFQALLVELETERSQRQEAELKLEQAQSILETAKKQAKSRILFSSIFLVIAITITSIMTAIANSQSQKLEKVRQDLAKVSQDFSQLDRNNEVLKEYLVGLLQTWGASEAEIQKVQSEEQIEEKLSEVLRANASLQQNITSPLKTSPSQGISVKSDGQNRSGVTVEYYPKEGDPQILQTAIEKLGFKLTVRKSTVDNVPTNFIQYDPKLNPEDIKLVAYTLIRAGIEIKAIQPFIRLRTAKADTIQIAAEEKLQSLPSLTVEEIRTSQLPLPLPSVPR